MGVHVQTRVEVNGKLYSEWQGLSLIAFGQTYSHNLHRKWSLVQLRITQQKP